MVRGPLAAIGIDEGRGFQRESQPAVGVADLKPLPGQTFTFRREKFQLAVARLGEARMVMGPLRTLASTLTPNPALPW